MFIDRVLLIYVGLKELVVNGAFEVFVSVPPHNCVRKVAVKAQTQCLKHGSAYEFNFAKLASIRLLSEIS
jgi:hypothetical protein